MSEKAAKPEMVHGRIYAMIDDHIWKDTVTGDLFYLPKYIFREDGTDILKSDGMEEKK